MIKLVSKVTAGILFTMVLTVYPAWAGVQYEQTTTNEYVVGQGRKVSEVSKQKVYVTDKKVRIEDQKKNSVLVIRFDKETSFHLDTKRATYTEKNFQALKTLQGQEMMQSQQVAPQRNVGMDAARKQLGKMGEGLSPERKGFMQQMMLMQQAKMMGKGTVDTKGSGDVPVEVKETNKSKSINGFACRRVKIVQGKKKIMDMWLTTQAGPKNYFSQILETLELFKPEVIKAVQKVDGFPIKQKYKIQTGPLTGTIQTVAIDKLSEGVVPDSLFEIPKEYLKIIPVAPSSDFAEDEEESF